MVAKIKVSAASLENVCAFTNVTDKVAERLLLKNKGREEATINEILNTLETSPHLRKTWQRKDAPAIDRALFQKYKDTDGDDIGFNGLIALCNEMDIDPASDKKAVYMCWQMGVKQMGVITETEWNKGLRSLGASSVEALKTKLGQLEDRVRVDREQFKLMYTYAFQLNLEEGRKKSLDLDNAIEVWKLLLDDTERFPLMEKFYDFLEDNEEIKSVTRDHWCCVLDFFTEYCNEDLSAYDENGAWPIIFDEFVEYMAGL